MRLLSVFFVSSALLTVTACGGDQPASENKDADADADKAEVAAKDSDKGEASLVNAPSPNSECLHEGKHDEGECNTEVPPADGGDGHFGSPFALQESRPLNDAITNLASIGSEPVQISGEVTNVCQKKGCWMVIKDGDAQARVLMKDHAFAVPFDGKGKKALVEGTIETKELSEGQVKHIEEDAGRDPSKVSGTRNEYIVTASGVRLES